ncbi:MAG: glutamate--tRNA ligase [Bacteroidales bacterium]|nr:glutamate--tRNA ligase [Bacteroidales bacterium]
MNSVRVRFAPSPTGPLHIGGVRTALYNYLFAKKYNGTFILRIEDTDQQRYVAGAEEYIIESLTWCGITFDEGVHVGGPFAPYRQSERKAIYKQYAEKLVEIGAAYYAFDSPEELDSIRKQFEEQKKVFQYDIYTRKQLKNSLTFSPHETQQWINSGKPYAIRFKIPENREIILTDLIRGEIHVNTNTLDDKVLFKSDGLPTYHLANIVDDHLMQITHVIRGEEWLPSLPLHYLLYEAFGWTDTMPQFAHLPLILKPDGKGKLSKRDGDKGGFPVFPCNWNNADGETYLGYREWGFLPEAFINMMALLGWNPGTEQEIFSKQELIQLFDLQQVNKSGARFDPEKAKWFNQQYIRMLPEQELVSKLIPLLDKEQLPYNTLYLTRIVTLMKERITFVHDIITEGRFFFERPSQYDETVVKKKIKPSAIDILHNINLKLKELEIFDGNHIEHSLQQYIQQSGKNASEVMIPIRTALVGTTKGPHLPEIMEIIGKEETILRIEKFVDFLKKSVYN